MIAVTGAAGFIGGRIALALHERGHELLGIDHAKVSDPAALALASTLDPAGFLAHMEHGARHIEVVIHQGACVDTTLRDWARMNAANVEYPSRLLRACLQHRIPFIYASSAAVYGTRPGEERPLNEYGRSKLFFDRTV